MTIIHFFHTYPGMYMVQSFIHALIATIVTGVAIQAWKIDSPIVRQRFRLSVILFSIFSYPLYQLINHDRGSEFFRVQALFDSSRWFSISFGNLFPLYIILILIFGCTTLIFIGQEMLPILKHFVVPTVEPQIAVIKPADDSPVGRALRPLRNRLPEVFIVHDDDLVLFSTTGKKPAVYISVGLVKKLSPEQLQGAVAHELAHIARSRRPVLILGFLLRSLMFFNPVVLVEFRRAIRNEEKICDDIAAATTGNPAVLAEALKRFHFLEEGEEEEQTDRRFFPRTRLEEYSHTLQLETRIARLEQARDTAEKPSWFPFYLSVSVIGTLNYYIV